MKAGDERLLCRAGDYQFGSGSGEALFFDSQTLSVTHTSSGRPRQILAEDGRIGTYTSDGRFTLGLVGGRRLLAGRESVRYRVVVDDESEPFVRDGRDVFAKFVLDAGEAIRQNDEVLVVDGSNTLLGVGRAELSGTGMDAFESGVAVKVREGVGTVST